MKLASILLVGAVVLCGPSLAQASISHATQASAGKPAVSMMLLARNGADNGRGDDHGGRGNGGSGRGGHDDGANHH